jgi:hypothetical protein
MTKRLTGDPELAAQVLSFRRAGVQFDVIADRLNLTPTAAKALFDQALAAHDPTFERILEADRLDRLHAAVWPRALKGEVDAVDRVVKISERREHVARVPKINGHAMRDAFDTAVTTSADLHPQVDGALVEAGRAIADRVDEATATGEGTEVTKALYLMPHMLNVLREMLATPASRTAIKAEAPTRPAPDSKLGRLRAVHDGSKNAG